MQSIFVRRKKGLYCTSGISEIVKMFNHHPENVLHQQARILSSDVDPFV